MTVLVVLLAAACGSPPPPPAEKPALAVILVTDGLSWENLVRSRDSLRGGLARLLHEGRVETNAVYPQLNTETCPGHASIATGAPPRKHGIVTNRWYETAEDGTPRHVLCTGEPWPRPDPPDPDVRIGADRLRVPTLGDLLVAAHRDAQVISLGGKDRSGIFLAGKSPEHVAYWLDPKEGPFRSSPVYAPSGTRGMAALGIIARFDATWDEPALRERFGTIWSRAPGGRYTFDPPDGFDENAFRYSFFGAAFDHDIEEAKPGYVAGLFASPFGDELLADLAIAILEDREVALGRSGPPDLLAVSFASYDYMAHFYGAESEEAYETLRRLDVQVGRVLDTLDRLFPDGGVTVAFTADHGMVPLYRVLTYLTPPDEPESMEPLGVVSRLNRDLVKALDLDSEARPIVGLEGWSLYYDPAFESEKIDAVLPAIVAKRYGHVVESVLLPRDKKTWPEFARNAWDDERSGNALLVPREGGMLHWGGGRGSDHGTQHPYDAHVPLIYLGEGIHAEWSEAAATPYDLAKVMGGRIGIDVP